MKKLLTILILLSGLAKAATSPTENPWLSQRGLVTVAWDYPNTTDSFRVYFSETPGSYFEYLEVPAGTFEYTIVGLDPKKVWSMVCVAVSPSGVLSEPSNEIVWDPQPPVSPTKFRIIKVEITTTLAP